MNKDDLLKEMRDSIGTKDPIIFFEKMVGAFDLLFEEILFIRSEVQDTKNFLALAIKWDPQVANSMLVRTIQDLRNKGNDGTDINIFHEEISQLKKFMMLGTMTTDYDTFCKCFIETLGYHPFLRESLLAK
jgi:hypothetical protein